MQLSREKSPVTMRSENTLNFGDLSKGMFNGGICEFESYNPSHAVGSLWAMSVCTNSREMPERSAACPIETLEAKNTER